MRPRESRDPVLLAVLFLAAALRIVGLVRFPFEQDELYTAIEARLLFASPLHPGIQARPLYYLLQHPLLRLLPVTEPFLRALPLVFGMLGIWATWGLTRSLFGRWPAAAAAALVAVSPWHLEATGMARYWSLVYLVGALFPWFLQSAYEEQSPKAYLKALLVLLLGLSTHPTFAFAAVGVAVGITLVKENGRFGWRWPSKTAWAYLWVPTTVFVGAAAALLKLTAHEGELRNWGGRGMDALVRLMPAMIQLATPAIVTAGLLGGLLLVLQADNPRYRRFGSMCLMGIAFQVLLLLVASSQTNVYAGYAISALPLGFASIGGLVALADEVLPARAAGILALVTVLVLTAAMSPSTASYLSDGSRFDYRPAFRDIRSIDPSLPVLNWPIILQRHYAPDLRGIELTPDPVFLDDVLRRERELWAVVSIRRYGIVGDLQESIARFLMEHCTQRGSYGRPRFDYREYRVELYRCALS